MSSIGAMLAGKHGGEEMDHEEPDGDEGGEPKDMAAAAVKAFFESGQQGDYAMAAEHLATAMEHCDSMMDGGDEPEKGHGALLIMPKGKT